MFTIIASKRIGLCGRNVLGRIALLCALLFVLFLAPGSVIAAVESKYTQEFFKVLRYNSWVYKSELRGGGTCVGFSPHKLPMGSDLLEEFAKVLAGHGQRWCGPYREYFQNPSEDGDRGRSQPSDPKNAGLFVVQEEEMVRNFAKKGPDNIWRVRGYAFSCDSFWRNILKRDPRVIKWDPSRTINIGVSAFTWDGDPIHTPPGATQAVLEVIGIYEEMTGLKFVVHEGINGYTNFAIRLWLPKHRGEHLIKTVERLRSGRQWRSYEMRLVENVFSGDLISPDVFIKDQHIGYLTLAIDNQYEIQNASFDLNYVMLGEVDPVQTFKESFQSQVNRQRYNIFIRHIHYGLIYGLGVWFGSTHEQFPQRKQRKIYQHFPDWRWLQLLYRSEINLNR